MRKRISAILIVLVLLISCTPVVFAANKHRTQQDLIDLACATFPEYRNKILYQQVESPSARELSDVELVCSESRNISDLHTLTYSEYSNGLILLTEVEADDPTVEYVDIISGSSATVYTININATCTGAYGEFTAENIKFSLISSGYDQINSKGTYSITNPEMLGFIGCQLVNSDNNPRVIWNESASDNAEIEYQLSFRYAPYPSCICDTYLLLVVGDNDYVVSHELHG